MCLDDFMRRKKWCLDLDLLMEFDQQCCEKEMVSTQPMNISQKIYNTWTLEISDIPNNSPKISGNPITI